jgi:hypothetical protein
MENIARGCLVGGLVGGAVVAAAEWNGDTFRAAVTICVLGLLGYLAGRVVRTTR